MALIMSLIITVAVVSPVFYLANWGRKAAPVRISSRSNRP